MDRSNPRNSTAVKTSLVLAFVALNLSVGALVSWVKLPIYLDSLGIVLATILMGWRSGVFCAIATVALGFFFVNPYLPFYAATSLAIVAAVEFLRRHNMYRTILTTLLSGLFVAVVAAVASAPVTALAFGGVTASGADIITAFFHKAGKSLIESVLLGGLSSEPIDKTLVALIAHITLRGLPNRFLQTFGFRGISD